MTRSIVRIVVVALAGLSLSAAPVMAGSHEEKAEKPEGSGGKKASAEAGNEDGEAPSADAEAKEKAPPKPRREGS